MPRRSLARLYQDEFSRYSLAKFKQDIFAGINVALVALPLALAFGVASGASAGAGLITSIIGGIFIGLLAGAPYQISGAKAVTSVVLIVLVTQYGLEGMWVAGILAGLLMFIVGFLKLGRFIAFIPAPVIHGFTAGISTIIIIRQFDNFAGIHTPTTMTATQKLLAYFTTQNLTPNLHSLLLGILVLGIMFLFPQKWEERFPSSLAGLIIASLLNFTLNWSATTISFLPQTLILEQHFDMFNIPWEHIKEFIAPALTLATLGSVEALMTGSVGSDMTGIRLQVNQQLIAQGVGNIILPFFGGIPTTSGMMRSKVAIQSGGQTRLVSIVHSIVLLVLLFLFAQYLELIPLSALAAVLIVTAIRSIDLDSIKFIFSHRFKTDIIAFSIAFVATIALNLSNAILIGTFLTGAVFLNKIASIDISIQEVDVERLKQKGIKTTGKCKHIRVAFLTGPLFFAATGQFNETFANLKETHALILSMRGVPLIDTTGLESIQRLYQRLQKQNGRLMLAGVHDNVKQIMSRGGLVKMMGEENFFWSSDQAIVEVEKRDCAFCSK